jgi:hypothetical protein
MASIIWDWTADQASRFNSQRLGCKLFDSMAANFYHYLT